MKKALGLIVVLTMLLIMVGCKSDTPSWSVTTYDKDTFFGEMFIPKGFSYISGDFLGNHITESHKCDDANIKVFYVNETEIGKILFFVKRDSEEILFDANNLPAIDFKAEYSGKSFSSAVLLTDYTVSEGKYIGYMEADELLTPLMDGEKKIDCKITVEYDNGDKEIYEFMMNGVGFAELIDE